MFVLLMMKNLLIKSDLKTNIIHSSLQVPKKPYRTEEHQEHLPAEATNEPDPGAAAAAGGGHQDRGEGGALRGGAGGRGHAHGPEHGGGRAVAQARASRPPRAPRARPRQAPHQRTHRRQHDAAARPRDRLLHRELRPQSQK